jgi:hypothetical protein
MRNKNMHEHKVIIRYMGEMLVTLFLYAVILISSVKAAEHMQEGLARTLVVVSPMIPFLLMVGALVRHFRRVDEYVRLQALENIVIAAGVTAGWTFTYGFLEGVGFPKLSMFTVWPVMGIVWAIVAVIRYFARR